MNGAPAEPVRGKPAISQTVSSDFRRPSHHPLTGDFVGKAARGIGVEQLPS